MNFLFTRRKKLEDKLPSRFAVRIRQLQRRWADGIQRRSERLSKKGKITALVVFVAAGATLSIVSLSKVVFSHKFSLSIGTIKKPVLQEESGIRRSNSYRTNRAIQGKLQLLMDSLARLPGGPRIRDSLLQQYPGLMDSITLLEQFNQRPATDSAGK